MKRELDLWWLIYHMSQTAEYQKDENRTVRHTREEAIEHDIDMMSAKAPKDYNKYGCITNGDCNLFYQAIQIEFFYRTGSSN